MININIFILLLLLNGSTIADTLISENTQKFGRYTLVKVGPNTSEIQPLSAIKKLMFPSYIQNVYNAMQHILKETGYTLNLEEESKALFNSLNLPSVHRELGPISIIDALRTLAGPVWKINVDAKLRKVSIYDDTLKNIQTNSSESHQNSDDFQQSIAIHYSEIILKDLIKEIIPRGWKINYEIPHDKITQIVTFHAESTRRKMLEQLFANLHLEGVFYPLRKILLVKNVNQN